MHDCPSCRVPLHGWEEVCPSCGTRQVVRKRRQFSSFRPEQPGINWLPIVLSVLVVGVVIILALPGSWIGKLVKEGPPKPDPMEKMTFMEARNIVEQELTTGLTAAGGAPKLSWGNIADGNTATGTAAGKPADKTLDAPINLTVDVSLPDPNSRKAIVDRVKDYMEKAKIMSLTMNDAKSHAHWTYNMTPALVQPEE
jgi:hypothetical protein